jgi:hypothetical protein
MILAESPLKSMTKCENCAATLIWFDRFPQTHQGWWEFREFQGGGGGLMWVWHPHSPARCRDVREDPSVKFTSKDVELTCDEVTNVVIQPRQMIIGLNHAPKAPPITIHEMSAEELAEFKELS